MKKLIIALLCVLLAVNGCAGGKPKRASLVTRSDEENQAAENASVTKDTDKNIDEDSEETGSVDPYEKYTHLLSMPGEVSFDSDSYCVINNQGDVLLGKEEFEKRAPASITKVLTALVALERVSSDTRVMVTEEDLQVDILSSGVYPSLKPGEVFTVEELIYALLLPSTNAAGNILARAAAGNTENFAGLMNEKARELGAVDSHFVNPHGLDTEGHYSCAYDMALILKAACENEELKKILGTEEYVLPATDYEKERSMHIGHPMVNGSFKCEGVYAGKTGWSENALSTMLTAVLRDDTDLFVCTLHSDDGRCPEDTRNLIEIAYAGLSEKEPDLYPLVSDYTVEEVAEGAVTITFRAENHPDSVRVLWFDSEIGPSSVVEIQPEVSEGIIKFTMDNLSLHHAYNLQLYAVKENGESAVELHILSTREKQESSRIEINGESYIFNDRGFLCTGAVENEEGCFYADALGRLERGFAGERYYTDEHYRIVTGWFEDDGKKYYAGPDGRIVKGLYMIEDELHEFDENGALIR